LGLGSALGLVFFQLSASMYLGRGWVMG